MEISNLLFRRLILVYAAVIAVIALVLALAVIPPVNVEASLGATPEKAVVAFWFNIGLNFLSAVALVSIAIRSKGRHWISTSLLVMVGLIILLLGIALADAASAYKTHGRSMQNASLFLFICAVADFLSGVSVVFTALLREKGNKKK